MHRTNSMYVPLYFYSTMTWNPHMDVLEDATHNAFYTKDNN